MSLAILDPFSGIAGDMTLGALIACGLDPEWLRALPARLGLDGVRVDIAEVQRAGIACVKVDFAIPAQPHGRHVSAIRKIIAASGAPEAVRARADSAFMAIATIEGAMHGTPVEKVHLHEVGAVDAILDVIGSIWGLALLGVTSVYVGPIALGDGTVEAAHGTLPVPAPATLKLLEGHQVRSGPPGSGELTTPTGAALVHVLSLGAPPASYVPLRSGFGAGTKDFHGRANALRLVLAEAVADGAAHESMVMLAADIDDMTGEYLADLADSLRSSGAADVVLVPTIMKKGRPGTRIEVLTHLASAEALETLLLCQSTTLGVRRTIVERIALPRRTISVDVDGHRIAVKVATLPDGGTRAKPEYVDVHRVAEATGLRPSDIFSLAAEAARREDADL
ncbi:MAG TPA: nickel pincer cofactor biosynthesis protein LarC, partial [Gemmatimonadaceae bacterium]|nr:nickel pincer cofactor biosynthesis protein LarC [Gemmatimonadaceae bacterium]